ncbi:hypothetical protein TI39_contig4398g00001, partial [Zymoseptoria brevis]
INDPERLGKHGDCWHWKGIPGRSIKVKCRKTGEKPDWESELHWKDATSSNKHEDEYDAHGNPVEVDEDGDIIGPREDEES